MCDKAVGNYAHALKFVPNGYKNQEISVKLFIIILLHAIYSGML